MTLDRGALAADIYRRSYLRGEFVLRSGLRTNEYFDKYRFESDPALLKAIADALAPLVPRNVDGLAGLELGGVPLATLLGQTTGLPVYFVRKEAKTYGTCQLAEGGDVRAQRLLVVEDVATTGGQIAASTRALRERGAVIEHAVVVIDREQGATANLLEIGVGLHSLFTMAELHRAASLTTHLGGTAHVGGTAERPSR